MTMVYLGIDVAKDKHDCYIVNSDGEILANVFTIPNDQAGFNLLLQRLKSVAPDLSKVKVGLEATGHYSYNILGLMSNVVLTSYTAKSYHNEELKSLTRYRFDKVQERAKLKTSVARLVSILFPELDRLVPTLHMHTVYALLAEFPGASQLASCHLTRLTHLVSESSKGRYKRDKAIQIREAARNSIGSVMSAKSMELKHTIHLIEVLTEEINEIESSIKRIMDADPSPILTIPGISYRMGAMILAEIGDFSRFSSPDQILAYAGLSPSTYQSGKLDNAYPHMEKRGSHYLRFALFNATRFVCNWDPTFAAYLAKKRAEGKHYYVAISHAAKKLVRLIFALVRSGQAYSPAT